MSKAERDFAEHQQRVQRQQMLEFIVGQRMGEYARSRYCIMLTDTKMPMKDPGMDKPFMTPNEKHAKWVCDQARKEGYKCVVVTAHELVQHLMNELGKKASSN
jgi:hypothetical protein